MGIPHYCHRLVSVNANELQRFHCILDPRMLHMYPLGTYFLLSLGCFSILVDYYFQVSFSKKQFVGKFVSGLNTSTFLD